MNLKTKISWKSFHQSCHSARIWYLMYYLLEFNVTQVIRSGNLFVLEINRGSVANCSLRFSVVSLFRMHVSCQRSFQTQKSNTESRVGTLAGQRRVGKAIYREPAPLTKIWKIQKIFKNSIRSIDNISVLRNKRNMFLHEPSVSLLCAHHVLFHPKKSNP